MANRDLTNPQLTQIAQQAQISVELLEVDWTQTSGINAQGRTDGYLTITPGASTTFKYGNANTWAASTQRGQISVIASPTGTETVDYLKRISFKYDGGWKASVGYTLERGYVTVSDVNPTLTALKVDGKFYINLHYNSQGFYLFDSSNNLITSTTVIKHDYGMDFNFTNAPFMITTGGKDYLPLGTWLSFSEIEEQVNFQVTDITIGFNGIDYIHSRQNGETYGFDYFNYDADYQSYEGDPNSKYAVTKLNNPIWRFLVDNYVGRRVRIYRAFMNQSYSMIGDPLLIFEGEMTRPTINISPGGGANIAVTCSSQWKNFERRNGRHTNYKEQKNWADKNLSINDYAFEYTYQNTRQIRWGKENPVINSPTNLRYTVTAGTGGTYYNFVWTAATGAAPDQYEIHWKQPPTSGTPYSIFQTSTTYWKSPLVPTGEDYSIKVFAVKDGVRSKASALGGEETGATDFELGGSGYGGYYGYDYQQYEQP
jgi:hypothetical protein